MKLLAIVLARKNSKRLKNKHHLLIGNKSMIEYTFDFLNNLNFFENIIVSTDDKKILSKVKKKYSNFIPFQRSAKLSKDSTDSYEVLISVYNLYKKKYSSVDGIFLFQPTSPFRKISTVKKMIKIFKLNRMKKSVVTVSKVKDHPEWMFYIKKNKMIKYKKNDAIRMSQYLKKIFIVNGLGYLLVPSDLKKQETTIPKNSIPLICETDHQILDIDTKNDLDAARAFTKYFKL